MRLRLVHGLDDVPVLDIADGHKGCRNGHEKGHQGINPALAGVLYRLLHRIGYFIHIFIL
jgi:hypothetical protein